MEEMTWNCEICGEERADRNISVLTYPIQGFEGAERNLKYCNGREECKKRAELKAKEGSF